MEGKIEQLFTDMQELEKEVKWIQLALEKETNRKIRMIAEGYRDPDRNFDEKERILLRVNSLENEVRKLKERIEQIA